MMIRVKALELFKVLITIIAVYGMLWVVTVAKSFWFNI